jgi:hypothetical protein
VMAILTIRAPSPSNSSSSIGMTHFPDNPPHHIGLQRFASKTIK